MEKIEGKVYLLSYHPHCTSQDSRPCVYFMVRGADGKYSHKEAHVFLPSSRPRQPSQPVQVERVDRIANEFKENTQFCQHLEEWFGHLASSSQPRTPNVVFIRPRAWDKSLQEQGEQNELMISFYHDSHTPSDQLNVYFYTALSVDKNFHVSQPGQGKAQFLTEYPQGLDRSSTISKPFFSSNIDSSKAHYSVRALHTQRAVKPTRGGYTMPRSVGMSNWNLKGAINTIEQPNADWAEGLVKMTIRYGNVPEPECINSLGCESVSTDMTIVKYFDQKDPQLRAQFVAWVGREFDSAAQGWENVASTTIHAGSTLRQQLASLDFARVNHDRGTLEKPLACASTDRFSIAPRS
ncbi:MAG: hypothetical protein R3A11_04320 [Bdellovibrionota bacterium]